MTLQSSRPFSFVVLVLAFAGVEEVRANEEQERAESQSSWTEPVPRRRERSWWPQMELVAGYGFKTLSWHTSSERPPVFETPSGNSTLGKFEIPSSYSITPSTIQQLTLSGRIDDVELGLTVGGDLLNFVDGLGSRAGRKGLTRWVAGYIDIARFIRSERPIWFTSESGRFDGLFTARQQQQEIVQPFSTELTRYRLDMQLEKDKGLFVGLRHELYQSPQTVYVGVGNKPIDSYVTNARFQSWDLEVGYNSLLPFRQKHYTYNGFYLDVTGAMGASVVRLDKRPPGMGNPVVFNGIVEAEIGWLLSKRFESLRETGVVVKVGLSGNLTYIRSNEGKDSELALEGQIQIARLDSWWGPSVMVAILF